MKWAYESVLQAIGVERELLKSLKNREKNSWDTMWGDSLYRTVIEGK